MLKVILLAMLAGAGLASAAQAAASVERGDYLVNTIAGCGNCHTPLGPNGPEFDKALSGRLGDIGRQRRLRRAANELSRLDDRMLKDIGITRSQIDPAAFGAPIRDRGR